ncbi:hypothetical protein [Sphingomonas sp.]|uniref:hypothetical protein n=1 Tax=Sphingomonas sp. TaxID=28214 RepID=UPI0035BC3092
MLGAALAGCVPNPRNEIPAVLAAAAARLVAGTPRPVCVEREVLRFADETLTDPPPEFTDLLASRFRGGGGIKGPSIAGVPIRHDGQCHQLYGPVIAKDRALVRATLSGRRSEDVWLRRTGGRWQALSAEQRDR